MDFTLRPAQLPTDYPRIAELLNAAYAKPVTAAELAAEDAELPAGSIKEQMVACDGAGRSIGYGQAYRYPNTKAGKFYIYLVVEPAQRTQGAGTALLTEIERLARAHGANYLLGSVRDNDPGALAFMEHRGYSVEGHDFYSALDLTAWDGSQFAGVGPTGIAIFPTTDDGQVYALMSRTMPDLPRYAAQRFMSFDTWKSAFRKPGTEIIVAADGEQLAGVTITERMADGSYYTSHTSVLREYRGRHIALALKLAAIERARSLGARTMTTGNDAANAPMLAVNQRLGYVPVAGGYDVAKYF